MSAGIQGTSQVPQSAIMAADRAEQSEESRTLLSIFFEQFAEHRIARASLVFLLFIASVAIFAPAITEYLLGVNPYDQNIANRYAQPGSRASLPASNQEVNIEQWTSADPERATTLIAAARQSGIVTASDQDTDVPYIINEKRTSNPEVYNEFVSTGGTAVVGFSSLLGSFDTFHALGTDDLGRDVLARLMYGARISLLVAALVGFFSAVIGLLFGATAGYFGGLLDNVLMRITDALLTIPTLPLYIILAAADLSKVPVLGSLLSGENQSIIKMVVVMASLTWMPIARIVRGAVLSIKESEYVMAAKTIGMSDASIIIGHVVPNAFGPLVVAVTLLMGDAMLIETGLSFLGLGIQPPMPSWGNMLQNAMELVRTLPLVAVIPGLMIFLTIIAINFVGDGLRDALDPKAIRR